MSDIKKLLDIMNEMATTSGSVATVAAPMGGTQKRNKDSIFYEGDAVCHECHQHECQCDENSRKAPESPEVANFGLWKNSILAGKEQKAKKKSKVKESVTDYSPQSQGGTRKELLAKLKSAKSSEEKSDLATRARKAGASQKELQSVSEGEGKYQGQYATKEEAIAYAKEKVKSFRDPDDGIEIWALPSGGFDVVHTMNANGRNHVVKNGGKKLGTVGQRYKGMNEAGDPNRFDPRNSRRHPGEADEATGESWSVRFMDGGKECRVTVKAASNKEALKKWRAKNPESEIIGISRAKPVEEGADLEWDDPDLAMARKFMATKKNKPVVIKPKDEVGFRVSSIGPGGRESNVKTDAAWDKKHGTKKIDELECGQGQRALNLAEQDFILNPHDVRRGTGGVVPKINPRTDREIEMACSDLFQSAKNARELFQMIKSIPEEQGLEGWVQEKIIKAADYLNTVREYMEGQAATSMASGNVGMGNMLDESQNPVESALVRRIMSQHTDVLQRHGPVAVMQAIEDVAGDVGDVEELGTSDISAYVRQVLSRLDNQTGGSADRMSMAESKSRRIKGQQE